jgi:hypothetical protein
MTNIQYDDDGWMLVKPTIVEPDKEAPKEDPQEDPQDSKEDQTPQEEAQKTPEEAPQKTPEEAQKTPEESPQKTPKDSKEDPQEAPQETPQEAQKTPEEPQKETPQENPLAELTVTLTPDTQISGATIVFRDSLGNFTAETITAVTFISNVTGTVTGNAILDRDELATSLKYIIKRRDPCVKGIYAETPNELLPPSDSLPEYDTDAPPEYDSDDSREDVPNLSPKDDSDSLREDDSDSSREYNYDSPLEDTPLVATDMYNDFGNFPSDFQCGTCDLTDSLSYYPTMWPYTVSQYIPEFLLPYKRWKKKEKKVIVDHENEWHHNSKKEWNKHADDAFFHHELFHFEVEKQYQKEDTRNQRVLKLSKKDVRKSSLQKRQHIAKRFLCERQARKKSGLQTEIVSDRNEDDLARKDVRMDNENAIYDCYWWYLRSQMIEIGSSQRNMSSC